MSILKKNCLIRGVMTSFGGHVMTSLEVMYASALFPLLTYEIF